MDGASGASVDWIAIYKLARLVFLGSALVGIGIYLLRRPELEIPARRMLEDDES
jgi:hypothetical protein